MALTMTRLFVLALLFMGRATEAFQQPALAFTRAKPKTTTVPTRSIVDTRQTTKIRVLLAASRDNKQQDSNKRPSIRRYLSQRLYRIPVLARAVVRSRLARSLVLSLALVTCLPILIKTLPAQASAPVMALPKAEGRDPASEALMEHQRAQTKKAQDELQAFSKKCREIEATQGEAARVKFEKDYKQQKVEHAAERQRGLEQLKRNLLDQGIDPFVDQEGQRQVTFYKEGVDLGEVPGTPFYLENEFLKKSPKRSQAYKLQNHRKMIALMVQDMHNRGVDPLAYFEAHQDNTISILDLPEGRAADLCAQYERNMELYGQIKPPGPGESSLKDRLAKDPKAAKQQQREAERLKQKEVAAQKAAQKVDQQKQKAQAKAELLKQKAAAKAKAAAQTSAAAVNEMAEGIAEEVEEGADMAREAVQVPAKVSTRVRDVGLQQIVPVVVAVGGGGLAFKLYQNKAARDEEERQRQFRLLMGGMDGDRKGKGSTKSALEEVQADVGDGFEEDDMVSPAPSPKPVEQPPEPAPKKRRLGLKGVFNRNKSERETDLNVVVGPDAEAPEFAMLLAKLLTFGAPGRFPSVQALPGDMPMKEFDLESAKQLLIDSRTECNIDLISSAEIFANVVNCMLIDIVDLASAALKEKDTKIQTEALDIVIEFIEHAASMYDAVAEGVVLSPVTYSGDLSKSKLENMYSVYAGSFMTNARDDFDSRLQSLQDIFKISSKKAEGLMMKAMQKNMMEQLKNGEGLEGMQEMLGGMGGMEGLAGGLDPEGEPDPAQVKEMLMALKQMKDSGEFTKEDLEPIKKEFKQAFGSSIEEITKEKPMDEGERELLDLMKAILED